MSWMLAIGGLIYLSNAFSRRVNYPADMWPWEVVAGLALIIMAVVVYLVSDEDAD